MSSVTTLASWSAKHNKWHVPLVTLLPPFRTALHAPNGTRCNAPMSRDAQRYRGDYKKTAPCWSHGGHSVTEQHWHTILLHDLVERRLETPTATNCRSATCAWQIPRGLIWDRTDASAATDRLLTASAMSRPSNNVEWDKAVSMYSVVPDVSTQCSAVVPCRRKNRHGECSSHVLQLCEHAEKSYGVSNICDNNKYWSLLRSTALTLTVCAAIF